MRGCWCLFDLSRFMKSGLKVAKTTLCAPICWPSSQAKVTSVNSLSILSSLKPDKMFSWKSFHFKQSFSELIMFTDLVWYLFNFDGNVVMWNPVPASLFHSIPFHHWSFWSPAGQPKCIEMYISKTAFRTSYFPNIVVHICTIHLCIEWNISQI